MNENGDSKYRWNGDGLKCVVGETSTRIETSLRGYYPLGKDRLRRIVDLPGLAKNICLDGSRIEINDLSEPIILEGKFVGLHAHKAGCRVIPLNNHDMDYPPVA